MFLLLTELGTDLNIGRRFKGQIRQPKILDAGRVKKKKSNQFANLVLNILALVAIHNTGCSTIKCKMKKEQNNNN